MRLHWLVLGSFVGTLVGTLGCNTSSYAVGSAVINTVVAATAAGVSRGRGSCYAACIDGTVCNRQNGLCEKRVCTRGCASTQYCDRSLEEPVCREKGHEPEPSLAPLY